MDEALQEQIKLVYPYGFHRHLISFTDKNGRKVSALPFETDEKHYMIRMTAGEARRIVEKDEDYDSSGILKEEAREEYEDKYADLDYLPDAEDGEDSVDEETDEGSWSDERDEDEDERD